MLEHISFANEQMKVEKYQLISWKCGKEKHDLFNEKYLKSAPAAFGSGGAIKFSAVIMVNRAMWQIVEGICFLH